MNELKMSTNANARVYMCDGSEEYVIDGYVDLSESREVEIINIFLCSGDGKYKSVKNSDPFDSEVWDKITANLMDTHCTEVEFEEFSTENLRMDLDFDTNHIDLEDREDENE